MNTLILLLIIISIFVTSIKSNENLKSSLFRTESIYLSSLVTTCKGGSITFLDAFVFDVCQITSSTTSKKVVLTDSIIPILTVTQYNDNQFCNGIGDGGAVILSGTIGNSCPVGQYTYYTILYESDILVIDPEQQANVNIYYSQTNCRGSPSGYFSTLFSQPCLPSTSCSKTYDIGVETVCPVSYYESDYDQSACFAGTETVIMESGEMKMISDVSVGARVLASNINGITTFSDVISVPHETNNIETLFTEIFTNSGNDIKMTANHLLPSGVCGGDSFSLIKASNVEVGSCIQSIQGQEQVTSIKVVSGKGIYTIVTNEEYVVVNGIIASPFAGNHALCNAYYTIYRSLYTIVPKLVASSWFTKAHTTFSNFLMKISP